MLFSIQEDFYFGVSYIELLQCANPDFELVLSLTS